MTQTIVQIVYEMDDTTKTDTFVAPNISTQLFKKGRAIVFLKDVDEHVIGCAQYRRVSRILTGNAVEQLRSLHVDA
jgi:hypothetical protein